MGYSDDSIFGGYYSLSEDTNKTSARSDETEEGVVGEEQEELNLKLSDEELLALSKIWKTDWDKISTDLILKQDKNENAWLGKLGEGEVRDNVIFEALETFLPNATRQNPVPVVLTDDPMGQDQASNVQKMLAFQADRLKMKIVGKQVLRDWCLYYFGVAKVGWDYIENDISVKRVRPQRLILDPQGSIGTTGYTGRYIGEMRRDSASTLIKRFPKKETFIKEKVEKKMGTSLNYTEWWTPEYIFWEYEGEVLAKYRNPHWNYDGVETVTDEYGIQSEQEVKGTNHFTTLKMPYVFLSIFNTGKLPVDDTSLIEQVTPLQNIVNKRTEQIDRNADAMNNGWIISGDAFTKDQATEFVRRMNRGEAGWVPSGDVNTAAKRDQAAPLPQFVFQDLLDKREEIKNIFGIRGLTAQGIMNEKTVRGKFEIKGSDGDRMSYITEFLEQFNDDIYNWMVQLFYVYYDEEHTAAILGDDKAVEVIRIKNTDLNLKLLVSVKEGSMIPKDPLSKRNEAIDLWAAGAIDPKTLMERLDDPDPQSRVESLLKWEMAKASGNPMIFLEEGTPQPAMPIPQQTSVTPQTPAVPGLPQIQ